MTSWGFLQCFQGGELQSVFSVCNNLLSCTFAIRSRAAFPMEPMRNTANSVGRISLSMFSWFFKSELQRLCRYTLQPTAKSEQRLLYHIIKLSRTSISKICDLRCDDAFLLVVTWRQDFKAIAWMPCLAIFRNFWLVYRVWQTISPTALFCLTLAWTNTFFYRIVASSILGAQTQCEFWLWFDFIIKRKWVTS